MFLNFKCDVFRTLLRVDCVLSLFLSPGRHYHRCQWLSAAAARCHLRLRPESDQPAKLQRRQPMLGAGASYCPRKVLMEAAQAPCNGDGSPLAVDELCEFPTLEAPHRQNGRDYKCESTPEPGLRSHSPGTQQRTLRASSGVACPSLVPSESRGTLYRKI
jgi:hypothetical protein